MFFYYLMVFLMPFHNHPLLSASIFGLTTIKIAGVLTVIAALAKILSTNSKFMTTSKIVVPFLLFVIVFTFSSFLHEVPLTERYGTRFTSAGILFFATSILVDNKKAFFNVLLVFVLAMNISSLYILKQYAAQSSLYGVARPGGTFGDSNYYAIAAAFTVAIALVLGVGAQKFKWFFLGSSGLCAVGVILSQSRGGFIALLFSLLYLCWRSKKKILGAVIITSSVIVLLLFVPNKLVERFQNVDVGAQKSTEHRLELIIAGWEMFKNNPLLGVGPGMFKEKTIEYFGDENRARLAHNSYLEVAAELGIFGLFTLLLLWYACVDELRKNLKKVEKESPPIFLKSMEAILVGMIGYLAGAVFLSVEYEKVIWLSVALSSVTFKLAQNNHQPFAEQ